MSILQKNDLRSYSLIALATFVVILGAFLHVNEYSMDEGRAWIIATTANLSDWPEILRYEGHPPLWYFLLKTVSMIIPSTAMLEVLSAVAGLAAIIVCLKRSPFTFLQKCFLSLNFYLIYQYTIIARLYSIELLLLFLVAALYPNRWNKTGKYFALLTLLCLTSAFGAAFAGVFFSEFLFRYVKTEREKKNADLLVGGMIMVLALSALFIVCVPVNSYAQHHFQTMTFICSVRWLKIFTFLGSSVFLVLTPDYFWGTALGLDQGHWNSFYLALTVIFLSTSFYVFRKNASALILFSGMMAVTTLFLYLIRFSAFNANYYGHATLAFLLASWIYLQHSHNKVLTVLLTTVLALQALSGLVAFSTLLTRPYSRGEDVARHLRSENVKEVIPGIWGYTSSYLVHSDARYFENGQLVKFTLSKSSIFLPEEYEHAIVPRVFTGIINQEHHAYMIERIQSRFCKGIPNLRLITNSPLPERFRMRGGLQEEERFTGAVHPMDNFFVYQFGKAPAETPFCQESGSL